MNESRATGCRIPRAQTVMRARSDFEAVLRDGYRMNSRNFVLRAHANRYAYARLGIIAGRKAARRAVDRNRAKRLIREAFRAASGRIGSYDVTVQLRSDLRGESGGNIRHELDKLLDTLVKRLGLPQAPPPDRQ